MRKQPESTEDTSTEESTPLRSSALGLLYRTAVKYPRLTAREEIELGRRIKEENDKEAFEKLVYCNLRLAPWIAIKYLWSSVPLQDLVQEGLLGLMKAAEEYDYRRKIRFSTYARWWIRQAVTRYIMNNSRVVRLPVHFQELVMQVLNAAEELFDGSRKPTPEEIARHLNLKTAKVKKVLIFCRVDTVSLDDKVHPGFGDDGQCVGDTLANQSYLDPLQALTAKKELEFIVRWVQLVVDTVKAEVEERDFVIFRSYYGLNPEKRKKNAREVSEEFGMSRNAVPLLISRVWKKLEHFQEHFDEQSFTRRLGQIAELEDLTAMQVDFQQVADGEYQFRFSAPWTLH